MKINRDFLEDLFWQHCLKHDSKNACLVVLRETRLTAPGGADPVFQADTGENNCDTLILWKGSDLLFVTGRSFAHQKAQRAKMLDRGECNRIAPSYVPDAWRKGNHILRGKPFPAWIQNRNFFVIRSRDLIWKNLDDYVERGLQWDNFHGWAPWSAGCVTVEGNAANPWEKSTGDWLRVMEWSYKKYKISFLSAAIFENSDLINPERTVRIGSFGPEVRKIQRFLGISADGDYGPLTYNALQVYTGRKPFDGVVPLDIIR